MSYATAAEVKAYSALSSVQNKSDDDLNNKYIPRAERIIDSYCRQNFNRSASKVIMVDGSGGNYLELPQRLLSLSRLRFIDGGIHAAQADGLTTEDFTVANHFSISDDTKVEVLGGQSNLINDPGVTKTYPFTTPANYTYDGNKIEVTGGVGKLKNQIPANGTFFASYDSNVNGTWGDGSLVGTPIGGASVVGNKLDLTFSDLRYVQYDAVDNADALQQGCVRFRLTPNFTNGPATEQHYFCAMKTASSIVNSIFIRHRSADDVRIEIWNSAGVQILEIVKSAIAFVSGNTYELELNWDLTSGATRFFIDGVLKGSSTNTGTRDEVNVLRVGTNTSGNKISNFSVEDFIFFDAVQHTADYTPGASIPATIYATDNPPIEVNDGLAFTRILDILTMVSTITGSDSIQVIVSSDDGVTYKYWNGSAWVASDESLAQSNPIATAQTNLPTLAVSGTFKIKFLLHSDNGSTTPEVDSSTVSQDSNLYPITDNLYIETTDAGKITGTNLLSWLALVATTILPTGVEMRILFSIDGRLSWLGWNGTRWTIPADATIRTNATLLADAIDNFATLDASSPLDYRIFLYSTDTMKTPVISQLAFASMALSANSIVSSVDVDQVFNKAWYIMLDSEPVRLRNRIGKQERLEDTLIFPLGFNNIEITGYFGYVDPPDEVRDATSEVVEKIISDEGSATVKHGTFKKEKIGDYSYERDSAKDASGSRDAYLSGVAKDYLRNYKKPILISRI